MFSNKYQIVSFCNYLGCNVDDEIGDGTKQGTCSKGQICFPDWTCKGKQDYTNIDNFYLTYSKIPI